MGAGAVVTPLGSSGADAGVLSGGGGGADAELGSLLSSSYDEAAGGGETPGQTDDAIIDAIDDLGAVPEGDATQNAAPADAALETVAQPGVEASPYQLTPDGKAYMVPKAELPQFQAAQKFFQQVSQHFATPQEAQSAAMQSADLRIMSNDWASGTEAGIRQVLNHFAGGDHVTNPQMQQRYQQSFSKMADVMPQMLQQINPQAHQAMAEKFVTSRIDAAYQKAATTGNAEDFKAAQEMDYGFTGKYKTDVSQIQKAPDPQVNAAEQRIREFETRQDAALKRDIGQFNQTAVEGAKFTQLGALIDKTLAKVKDRYTEAGYADLKAGVHRELVDTLKSQPEWWTEHQQNWNALMDDYRTTWKQGSPGNGLQPRAQAYIQSFLSRAQRALPQIAQKRVNVATQREQSARAANGQFAGQKPAATRQPAQAAAPAANGQMKRLSPDEWQAELNRAMSV